MIRREADLRSCLSSDDCIIGRWHQGLAPSLFKTKQRMYNHVNTKWLFNRVDLYLEGSSQSVTVLRYTDNRNT